MSAAFHPSDDFLLAYAAGSLDEAASLLVATHLALCPLCRAESERLETIGGVLLEHQEPVPLGDEALTSALSRLDGEGAPPSRPVPSIRTKAKFALLPEPLRTYVGQELESLAWRRMAKGIEGVVLLDRGAARLRLVRLAPSVRIRRHGHSGREMTLVLDGGFKQDDKRYTRGDVAMADETMVHAMEVDADGPCLCLSLLDAPLKLTGLVGLLVNPFLRK